MSLSIFQEVDARVKTVREREGNYWTIKNLPLTDQQKECVLEYLARRYWQLLLDTNIQDGHSKSYDPLLIEGDTAHSYVYDMEDGGRHHSFKDYAHLEEMLYDETLGQIKYELENGEGANLPTAVRKLITS